MNPINPFVTVIDTRQAGPAPTGPSFPIKATVNTPAPVPLSESGSIDLTRFDALCLRFPLRPIRDDIRYAVAEEIRDMLRGDTPDESDYLEVLGNLMANYEDHVDYANWARQDQEGQAGRSDFP